MKVMRWGTAALVAAGVAVSVAAEEQTATETVAPVAVDEELLKQVQSLAKEGLFVETFEEHEVLEGSRWFKSTHEKYASQSVTLDAYTVRTGHLEQDKGLVLDAPAKHYGLAVKLDEPLEIDGSESKKELVVQYELKLQKGLSCGGAYVKLLRKNELGNYADFSNDSPFVIMFGPDKCGANDKVHFIFQHKNPVTGVYEEKHMDSAPQIKSDKTTHLYTLVVRDDNTFEMLIDQKSVSKGSLFEDFTPAVLPSKEIDDPTDVKPSDWVEETLVRDPNVQKPDDWDEDAPAQIPDEAATKPADWLDDEDAMINDPSVSKPEDWDDEDDGEWVFPQIPNPKCATVSGCGAWKQPTKKNPAYKGKWVAPFIPNPAYKGEWKARQIPNPDYFTDDHPARLDPIGALAVEVWTMTDGITFDNFWLGNDYTKAEEFANLTFAPKRKLELEEQDKQRADEKRELEERRAKEDSYMLQVQDAAGKLWQYANENPVKGFGSIFVITIATILLGFFACCGKSQEQDDEKEEPAVATSATEKKKKEAANVTTESEDDGKQSVRQRKKAPVVKDD